MIAPTALDERAAALYRLDPHVPVTWREQRLLLRVVFFCLTAVAVIALHAFLDLLYGSSDHVIAAVICLGTGEYLIQRHRFFRTGIEEALWLAGMLTLVLALPSSNEPEALIVAAAAIGIAAARVRQPLFGAASLCCLVMYAHVKSHGAAWPIAAGIAAGCIAAAALMHVWERESTEHLFQAVVLLVPAAGYLFASDSARDPAIAAYALFAIALATIGILKRDRILLIASIISATVAALAISDLWLAHIASEYKLIAGGILTLAIAVALSRALRNRTTGFTASPEAAKDYEEALQLVGAMQVAHAPAREASPTGFESGGGHYGGAGSSGSY